MTPLVRRIPRTVLGAVLGVCLFLGACRAVQGYPGERRPKGELARLAVTCDAVGANIWLDQVDGLRVNVSGRDEVEILPGQRLLEGRSRGFGQDRKGTPFRIEFLARAGAEYNLVMTQPTRSDRMDISIEERDSGETLEKITIWP